VIQAALALSAHYFPCGDLQEDGEPRVSLDHAHFLLSGQLHLWSRWPGLAPADKQRIGRVIRWRPDELASRREFLRHARRLLVLPEIDSFRLPAGVPTREAEFAFCRVGPDLLGFADRVLDELEEARGGERQFPVATPGVWQAWLAGRDGGGDEQTSLTIPRYELDEGQREPVPAVSTVPFTPQVEVRLADLLTLAGRLDRAYARAPHYQPPYRAKRLRSLLAGTRTADGRPLEDPWCPQAGQAQLFNAPTGTGKTVLARLLAVELARRGLTVTVVLTGADATMDMARGIQQDLAILGCPQSCTPLMAPGALHERALKLAGRLAQWDEGSLWRIDHLAYGCALAHLVEPERQPTPGAEPCTRLRLAGRDGTRRPGESPGRHACPWRTGCAKFALARAACTASVVVTNHHNLQVGRLQIPVVVDGVLRDDLSVAELVLRRSQLLLVDEVDQFQSNAVDAGAHELVLASRRSPRTLLKRLDQDLGRVPVERSRSLTPIVSRARYLAEQLLNYIAAGDLSLPDTALGLHSSRWHLPWSNDRMLLRWLFDVADDAEVTDEQLRHLNALFSRSRPAQDEALLAVDPQGVDLDPCLARVAELLAEVVDNRGADLLPEVREELDELLTGKVPDPAQRAATVEALVLRAWLEALRSCLYQLVYETATLREADLESARELADRLGVYLAASPIPYGALGYLLFGFRATGLDDPDRAAELTVQAIGGDPHTYTAQLGSIVALALCGYERVVVGLSATAFFPGAAREHVLAPLAWWMTDADADSVSARPGQVHGAGMEPIAISGVEEHRKTDLTVQLGAGLWSQYLDAHLAKLRADRRLNHRARVLLVPNSYRQCTLLGRGIAQARGEADRICVAVPAEPWARRDLPERPTGCQELIPDEFEAFPETDADILIAPLARVARGLNIVVGRESAVASVWMCVRPVSLISEPAELFASLNAYGHATATAADDPVAVLEATRQRARRRLRELLRMPPHFSRLTGDIQDEIVAGILVDLIQLAGRARRGGTRMQLYLVDQAFHDTRWNSDLPAIIRRMHHRWDQTTRAQMAAIYGSTLTSLFDFASVQSVQPVPVHEERR
jgi:hypothetical protein